MRLLDKLRNRWRQLGLQARLNLQLAFMTAALFAVLLAVVLMIQETTIRRVAQKNGSAWSESLPSAACKGSLPTTSSPSASSREASLASPRSATPWS